GIERNGFRCDGFQRRKSPRRRNEYGIQSLKFGIGGVFQGLELVECQKSVDRARAEPPENDLACDRVHCFGVGLDELTDRRRAFGNPWTLIEQSCCLTKRSKIDRF